MAAPTLYYQARVIRDCLLSILFLFLQRCLPEMKPDSKDLSGKIAIVTGSNSGVGYGIALQLAEMGAHVVLACRNKARAAKARDSISETSRSRKVTVMQLDTASMSSVRHFAKSWNLGSIDILVHNAGVSRSPPGQDFTEDGFDYVYQTNFLASFLLTNLLESKFSPTARVVLTSSLDLGSIKDDFGQERTRHRIERGFHVFPSMDAGQYPQSKLMQVAFARRLQMHFDASPKTQRRAFSFEPGLVRSNILSGQLPPFSQDPVSTILAIMMPMTGLDIRQGAATGLHLAVTNDPKILRATGRYFDRMKCRAHQVDLFPREKLDRLWLRWCADSEINWI